MAAPREAGSPHGGMGTRERRRSRCRHVRPSRPCSAGLDKRPSLWATDLRDRDSHTRPQEQAASGKFHRRERLPARTDKTDRRERLVNRPNAPSYNRARSPREWGQAGRCSNGPAKYGIGQVQPVALTMRPLVCRGQPRGTRSCRRCSPGVAARREDDRRAGSVPRAAHFSSSDSQARLERAVVDNSAVLAGDKARECRAAGTVRQVTFGGKLRVTSAGALGGVQTARAYGFLHSMCPNVTRQTPKGGRFRADRVCRHPARRTQSSARKSTAMPSPRIPPALDVVLPPPLLAAIRRGGAGRPARSPSPSPHSPSAPTPRCRNTAGCTRPAHPSTTLR